jgi:hypothetical protein
MLVTLSVCKEAETLVKLSVYMLSSLFVKRNDIPSFWSKLISFKTEGPISSSQLSYHSFI